MYAVSEYTENCQQLACVRFHLSTQSLDVNKNSTSEKTPSCCY